jgi:hypothetical protein
MPNNIVVITGQVAKAGNVKLYIKKEIFSEEMNSRHRVKPWRQILSLLLSIMIYLQHQSKCKITSKPLQMQIKRTKISIAFFLVFSCFMMVSAQTTPFQIAIEPLNINGKAGLQTFAFAQFHNKWLIMGRRTDGLHRRQPWTILNSTGQNTRPYVIDPGIRLTHISDI